MSRPLIFVLGMHRSGTSAVAGLLDELGVWAGPQEDLMPGDFANPLGYYERRAFMVEMDKALEVAGGAWDQPPKFDDESLSEARRAVSCAIQSVRESIRDHTVGLIKDPRLCLFASWVTENSSPADEFVTVFRNPVAVARSLKRAQGVPLEVGLALWEYYNVQIIDSVDRRSTPAIDFDRAVGDRHYLVKSLMRLSAVREVQPVSARDIRLERWRPDMRTQARLERRDDEWLTRAQKLLYRDLVRWSRGDKPKRPLSARVSDPCSSIIERRRDSVLLRRQLDSATTLITENEERLTQAAAEADHLRISVESLEQEISNLVRLNAEAAAAAVKSTDEGLELQRRISEQEVALGDLRSEIAEVEGRLAEALGELAVARDELVGLVSERAVLAAEKHEALGRSAEVEGRLAEALGELAVARDELVGLVSERSALEALARDIRSRWQDDNEARAAEVAAEAGKQRDLRATATALKLHVDALEATPDRRANANLPEPGMARRSLRRAVRRWIGRRGDEGHRSLGEVGLWVRELFDAHYYSSVNEDVAESGLDPWVHYVEYGMAELRRPHPLMDPSWYLSVYEDVAAEQCDPVVHYLTRGASEGRDPCSDFDSDWYLDRYPDVAQSGLNPLLHYIATGASESRDPSPHFSTSWYLEQNPDVAAGGLNALAHYVEHGKGEGRAPHEPWEESTRLVPASLQGADALPIRFADPIRRINVVTDSLGGNSLFGGVATAIILGAEWARSANAVLRVVTRADSSDVSIIRRLLDVNGVNLPVKVETAFASDEGCSEPLEVSDQDLFLTTSWWTTSSVLKAVPSRRVVYLLQEDERDFYPAGDLRLEAARHMSQDGLRVVVNTARLREYLMEQGVLRDATISRSFEPSFRLLSGVRRSNREEGNNFLFYARPKHPRNLFGLGLASIEAAVTCGLLDEDRWSVHFVGSNIPRIRLSDGRVPERHEGLTWAEYRDLLGTIDAGLSLMASPHPSYPPLDMAAAGAVVVTNSWPGKQPLELVSDRILVHEPRITSLLDGIGKALELATSNSSREVIEAPYCEDWTANLHHVVSWLIKPDSRV